MALVGFLREGGFNLYSGEERVFSAPLEERREDPADQDAGEDSSATASEEGDADREAGEDGHGVSIVAADRARPATEATSRGSLPEERRADERQGGVAALLLAASFSPRRPSSLWVVFTGPARPFNIIRRHETTLRPPAPQRRRRRPQHRRKDDAGRRAALRGRRHDAARQDRGRHLPDRLRRRGDRPEDLDQPRRAPTPSTATRGSTSSTPPATASSRPRPARRSYAADAAIIVLDAVSGVEVQTERVWKFADGVRAPGDVRRQPDGPGARLLRPRHRGAPEEVRPRRRRPADPGRRGEGLPRHRRPRPHGGPHPRGRQARGRPDPRRPRRARRRPSTRSSSRWWPRARTTSWRSSSPRARSSRRTSCPGLKREIVERKVFPVLCASSAHRHRRRCASSTPASRCSPPRRAARSRASARTASPSCVFCNEKDHAVAQVFKTVSDPFAGRISYLRVLAGHFQSDGTYWNSTKGVPERFSGLFLPQGKEHVNVPEARAGDIVAVAKLKETMTGDTLTTKDNPVVLPTLSVPGGLDRLRHRAQGQGRRGQDLDRPPQADRGGSLAQLPARRGDQGVPPRRRLAAPRRDRGRAAEEALRRRGHPPSAEGPLPRDDHAQGRGARPPQEADRRPRPVRRLPHPRRAAAPRQGLRVRRRHLRRLDPAQLHPGRREGHPGGPPQGLPRRIPDGRLPRDPLRRPVPRRRLLGARVQARRRARLQGGDGAGASRRCSSRS